jgi:hypothetical protein
VFELTSALGDLSTQVKVGWTIWLAWGIVSLGWYRHARVAEHVAPAMPNRYTPAPPANRERYEEDPDYSDSTASSYDGSAGSSDATY